MIRSLFSRRRVPVRVGGVLLSILPALLMACSDGSDHSTSQTSTPFAELYDQGIIRYVGLYTPMLSQQDGPVTNHYFGAGDGPLCGKGAPYSMATRDQGSQDLVIFLEGGGACWSDFCFYVSEATPGIPPEGLLDTTRQNNPVKDWNQVYVPYCDGSLLAGDVDIDTDADGQIDRYQRGLRNLSAALDVAVRTFPAPRRILLAGQSGGALGTIFALPVVRFLYPNIPIDVLNDSGVGVLKPNQPEFLRQIISEWNLGAFIPASCADCIAADGHLSDYLIWQMDQDHQLKRGLLSYTRDTNLADLFLQIGGAAFETALFQEMRQQEEASPGRTRSWIVEGSGHTFVETDPDRTAGGIPLMDWIGFMVSDSDLWVSAWDVPHSATVAGGQASAAAGDH
ncbi:MAG: pectin acetylesterase-family hydrolase [Halioglobus sp.]